MKSGFKLTRVRGTGASAPQALPGGFPKVLLASAVLWLLAVSAGLWVLWGYENRPGLVAQPPARWPTDSHIRRSEDHATLVMLAHPHCPCTRASIGELASLMAQTRGQVTAYVLFLQPAGFDDDWVKSDLWQSAAVIPGVIPLVDHAGAEAQHFNAATSGQTILYDAQGRLLFSGGITASRGHSGDNAGRSSVASLVNFGAADHTETFVFGCPLFNKDSECQGSKHEIDSH